MNSLGYEYHSDFARRYVTEGRIETILKVLSQRFGTLSETTRTRVRGARGSTLDKLEVEILSVKTPDAVLELLK